MTRNNISDFLVKVSVNGSNQDGGRYDGPCGTPVEIQASQASLELSMGLGLDVCQSCTAWTLIFGFKTYPRKELAVDESGIWRLFAGDVVLLVPSKVNLWHALEREGTTLEDPASGNV